MYKRIPIRMNTEYLFGKKRVSLTHDVQADVVPYLNGTSEWGIKVLAQIHTSGKVKDVIKQLLYVA